MYDTWYKLQFQSIELLSTGLCNTITIQQKVNRVLSIKVFLLKFTTCQYKNYYENDHLHEYRYIVHLSEQLTYTAINV